MNEQNRAAMMPALIFFGGLTLILIALFSTQPANPPPPASMVAQAATSQPTEPVVIALPTVAPTAETVALNPAAVKAGENVFQTVCFACHGFNAMGIPGLGKPLIGSEFVNSETDAELLTFLNEGRDVNDPLNTTGVLMPAKGGNPALTDTDLLNVIAYIRSLNGGAVGDASSASTTSAAEPTAVATTVAAGPTSVPAEFSPIDTSGLAAPTSAPPVNSGSSFANPGQADFVQMCAGCHGLNGEGQYLLTKPLTESELVKTMNSMAILTLLNEAHGPANPDVAFQHPYRGGYPELRDDQLLSIITYLFTVQGH